MPGWAVEDYLKAIFKLSLTNKRVTPSGVADHLGVSGPAVTKMVRRLQELALTSYDREAGLSLTAEGERVALEVIRHHRLLELYLARVLGYSWDQVHEEAERLEHVISEHFEDRIEALLGYPTRDPHGAPIPTRDGRMEIAEDIRLSELSPGSRGVIQRVSDGDAGMLAYLGELGMYPGTPVEVTGLDPYGGPLRIRVSGREAAIGAELASAVFVTVSEDTRE